MPLNRVQAAGIVGLDGSVNTFANIPQTSVSGLSTTYGLLNLPINAQLASYTLLLSDAGGAVEINNASANNLNIPLNSVISFPIGCQIMITQTGAGQTTLNPISGVTLNATPGLKLRAQWSAATLIKRATNTWIAIGDLSA
jgi:hypothetical protein